MDSCRGLARRRPAVQRDGTRFRKDRRGAMYPRVEWRLCAALRRPRRASLSTRDAGSTRRQDARALIEYQQRVAEEKQRVIRSIVELFNYAGHGEGHAPLPWRPGRVRVAWQSD